MMVMTEPARAEARDVIAMGAQFAPGIKPKVGGAVPGTEKLPTALRSKLKITSSLTRNGLTVWTFTTPRITGSQAMRICSAMVAAKTVINPKMCDVIATIG
jgi:hypothetical protein